MWMFFKADIIVNLFTRYVDKEITLERRFRGLEQFTCKQKAQIDPFREIAIHANSRPILETKGPN